MFAHQNKARGFVVVSPQPFCRYYNGCLFYNVQQNFMIQTGDPTATGKGGTSVYGLMYGEQAR